SEAFAMGGNDIELEGQWVYYHSKTPVPSSVTWLPGEPNNSGQNEDCMTFRMSKDGLNDVPCNTPVKFLCEVPLRGYLLELDDDAERDFTLEFAKRIGGATLFAMGGNDIKLEGQWVYTHSKKLVPSSVTWLPGEPNNSGGEDCMAFWIDMNGINDIRCYNNPAKYICEIPLR
ncbi:hypothetical protein EGW08_003960, partial [Elysia chlorotica]